MSIHSTAAMISWRDGRGGWCGTMGPGCVRVEQARVITLSLCEPQAVAEPEVPDPADKKKGGKNKDRHANQGSVA